MDHSIPKTKMKRFMRDRNITYIRLIGIFTPSRVGALTGTTAKIPLFTRSFCCFPKVINPVGSEEISIKAENKPKKRVERIFTLNRRLGHNEIIEEKVSFICADRRDAKQIFFFFSL